jgi:ATP-dependent protease ClpP protease subunit
MWLLENSVRRAIEQAQTVGITPTFEQQQSFEASHITAFNDGTGSRLLTLAGNSAEISIKGVLTKAPSFLAMIFGGGNTTYSEIISALAEAEQDDNVTDITLNIDSPGGSFEGLFDTLEAISSASKPITAIASNVVASAAYAIAAQADSITAANHSVLVGSIGVAADIRIDEDVVTITSTEAPNKRPDVTTEEGKAVVREQLDAMHDIFVDAIASGRNITTKEINTSFGQGATVLANEALNRGMIDTVAKPSLSNVNRPKHKTTAASGIKTEDKSMDLATLKTSHPDVHSAAVAEGVTGERDRVVAHLTMGEASGDMVTAIAAINDGSAMTATLQSKYMAAGMNKADGNARKDDDDDAGSAADGAGVDDDAGADASEQVAAEVESQLGVIA